SRWAPAVAKPSFIIHYYDHIDSDQSWLTLAADLSEWRASLSSHSSQRPRIGSAQTWISRTLARHSCADSRCRTTWWNSCSLYAGVPDRSRLALSLDADIDARLRSRRGGPRALVRLWV